MEKRCSAYRSKRSSLIALAFSPEAHHCFALSINREGISDAGGSEEVLTGDSAILRGRRRNLEVMVTMKG